MKIVANIILVILIIPLFLIGLLAVTIRFQLLSPSFWEGAFESHNTYSSLANVLKKSFEDQVVSEGGARSDIRVLTDIVTPENVKDVVNRNLANLLNYANGKSRELKVYLALSKVPKNLLPISFRVLPEEMPAGELISKFNIQGGIVPAIQNIPLIGRGATLLLVLDLSLLLLFAILLFLLADRGKRFVSLGTAFLICGVIAAVLYQVGSQIGAAMAIDLVQKKELVQVLIGTLAPPVLAEILKLWLILGVAFVACGLVLLFLKKR